MQIMKTGKKTAYKQFPCETLRSESLIIMFSLKDHCTCTEFVDRLLSHLSDLSGSNLPRVPEMSSQVGNQTLTSPSSLSPLAIPEPFVFKTVPIGNKQTYEEFLDSITPQVCFMYFCMQFFYLVNQFICMFKNKVHTDFLLSLIVKIRNRF